MKTTQILKTPQTIEDEIRGKMVYSRDGILQIGLGNYALDFKKSFAFLGFTKKGDKAILGDIYVIGPDALKYKKRFGNITKETGHKLVDNKPVEYTYYQLSTDGHRYSETLEMN